MPALRTADAMTLHAVWMAFMRRVRSPVASGCLCSWSRMYRVRVMGSWPAGRSGVMSMVGEWGVVVCCDGMGMVRADKHGQHAGFQRAGGRTQGYGTRAGVGVPGYRGGESLAILHQLVMPDSATLRAVFGGVACPPRLAEAYVVTEK